MLRPTLLLGRREPSCIIAATLMMFIALLTGVVTHRRIFKDFFTFRPGKAGEISFTGGYPFAAGSTVEVAIDGQPYQFFSDGEWAWPGSAEDDASVLAAMKNGTSAVLTAKSGKGTKTVDTFSLRGFTAAMEDAEKRCQ